MITVIVVTEKAPKSYFYRIIFWSFLYINKNIFTISTIDI